MKVCLIGNSHLAAFRTGWSKIADRHPGVEAEFFGAKGGELKALRVRRGLITTAEPSVVRQLVMTSGGKSAINPKDYDGFLIVGLGAGSTALARLSRSHRTAAMTGKGQPEHLVSEAMFAIAARRRYKLSLFGKLIEQVRSVVADRPIIVVSTPLPRARIVEAEPDLWLDADLVGPRADALWNEVKEKIAAEHRVVFVEQPPETVDNRFFTRDEFSHGSVRLEQTKEHDEEEFYHMNADYGAAYMGLALARMDELVRARGQAAKSVA